MLIGLKKTFSILKNYWYVPVILIAFIVMAIILRSKPDGLARVLGNAVENHRKEVEVIDRTHEEEIAKRDKALGIYHSTVEQLDKKYKEDQRKLNSKQKKEIKKLIEENRDNPEALADRISDFTGFDVILPEKELND